MADPFIAFIVIASIIIALGTAAYQHDENRVEAPVAFAMGFMWPLMLLKQILRMLSVVPVAFGRIWNG